MENKNTKNFEDAIKLDTEFIFNGTRIYTLTFEDGDKRHFIIPVNKLRDFIADQYDIAVSKGEVFTDDEYEEKREEYITSIGGK